MPSIHPGSWQKFPSDGGGVLALDGDRMAVAGEARLRVWKSGRRIAAFEAPAPAPGTPRFKDRFVYWGPGYADLVSGEFTVIEAALPNRRPGGGERPCAYAWSPQGDRLLGSFATGEADRPARVALFDGKSGSVVATLREGAGLPPRAAWVGERAVVVGFADPEVFDHSGKHQADITLDGAPVAGIDAPAGERGVLVVELNRALVWIDAGTWTVRDRWPGPWLHGAISPDGRLAVALDTSNGIHFARLENDRFKPAGSVAARSRTAAVAITCEEIATVGGGEVWRAPLGIEAADADSR